MQNKEFSKNPLPPERAFSIEKNHPGCMRGILHVFNHHRRQRGKKKMLPHRRHSIDATSTGEIHQDTEDEMKKPTIEEKTAKHASMRSRIKALIYDENSKKKNRQHRSSSCPTQVSDTNLAGRAAQIDASSSTTPQENEKFSKASTLNPLQPRVSEEHKAGNKKCHVCAALLAMDYVGLGQVNDHRMQLIETDPIGHDKLNRMELGLPSERLLHAKESEKDAPLCESNHQSLNILDVLSMSKQLFKKGLQDPSSSLAYYFNGPQTFTVRKRSTKKLTKSMSFPLAGIPDERNKLEHEDEVKSCKIDKHSESSKPLMAKCMLDGSLTPPMGEHECLGYGLIGSTPGKNSKKNSKYKHFKNLKQKIKHAIKEGRKEKHRIAIDALLHKIPGGNNFSKDAREQIADLWKEPTTHTSNKSSPQNSSDIQMGRMQSLKESLDRYRELYYCSFNTKDEHYTYDRLKLRINEITSPSRILPKTLKRIHSLPILRHCYVQSEDSQCTTSSNSPKSITAVSENEKNLVLHTGSENETPLESGIQNNLAELGELDQVLVDVERSRPFPSDEEKGKEGFGAESGAQLDTEVQATSPVKKLEEPDAISVPDSSEQDITSPDKVSLFEETNTRYEQRNLSSESLTSLHCLDNSQVEVERDSLMDGESQENLKKVESPTEKLDTELLQVLVNTKDTAQFNYPMNPSVFEEVKECLCPGRQCSENEECFNCDHMLLFDLINEVLLHIYERSVTYSPKLLSSTSNIRPIPVGYRVLEEVWARVSYCMSWRPEADQPTDKVIGSDLERDERWMNLQFEAQLVVMELEDMILDDLLDELVWS
ncbi:hypothetical protein NMG60_11000372 [Bertholletia excelsa]